MTSTRRWHEKPAYNWTATVVSLTMLALYIQRLLGPAPRASTPYAAVVWGLMFVTFLASAIRHTWFHRR